MGEHPVLLLFWPEATGGRSFLLTNPFTYPKIEPIEMRIGRDKHGSEYKSWDNRWKKIFFK